MARVSVILNNKILVLKLMSLMEARTYVVNWRMHHPYAEAEIELEIV
jgi:hypothetical protein